MRKFFAKIFSILAVLLLTGLDVPEVSITKTFVAVFCLILLAVGSVFEWDIKTVHFLDSLIRPSPNGARHYQRRGRSR